MSATDAFMSLNKILDIVSTICPRIEHYSDYVVKLNSINEDEQEGKNKKT